MAKYSRKVIALEPQRENFKLLKLNILLNSAQNIKALNVAAGAKIRTQHLFKRGGPSTNTTIAKGVKTNELCQVIPLDKILEQLSVDPPYILKRCCKNIRS